MIESTETTTKRRHDKMSPAVSILSRSRTLTSSMTVRHLLTIIDTSASLMRVLEAIRILESEADADLILLTGDLVHEPTETVLSKVGSTIWQH